jgi:hypothetical protein
MHQQDNETLRAAPRASLGMLAVAPIPAGAQSPAHHVSDVGGMSVVHLEPGILAGIVLNIGPVPLGVSDQIALYDEGATVYYRDGSQIRIGDNHYISMGHVLAWEPAPDA